MQQLEREQQRLREVLQKIDEQVERLQEKTMQQKQEVIHIRKHFWDDLKVSTDSFDDYLETVISLRQEAQALSVSQSSHRHRAHQLATLQQLRNIPYFGRIDFWETGVKEAEQIYIGMTSLLDESGEQFIIYDWRAPVCSMYYDYPPGAAAYETIEGTIQGQLQQKWQYVIRDSHLLALFDTSITIGDELLQQVLGQQSSKQMQNIVATIQLEQNKIIRHDQGRILIVQGAAGSGKTSAAMQRIAYLLYTYRQVLQADQIVLFSPNAMFSSYVSNVLPELGEDNMQQVTFQQYLNERLGTEFVVEDVYEQLEYVLTAANDQAYEIRTAAIEWKGSASFFAVVERYVLWLERQGMLFHDIYFRDQVICTADELQQQFYRDNGEMRLIARLEKLQEWIVDQTKLLEKTEWKKEWVQDEIELLSDMQYYSIQRQLAKKNGFVHEKTADYEMSPAALARFIVRQKLKKVKQQIADLRFVDFPAIYKQLYDNSEAIRALMKQDIPAKWSAICQSTMTSVDQGKLLCEDATPYLFLKEIIQGFHINRHIKHVVIDEGQDYSSFQYEFFKRLFPAAKFTILGDFNQAIYAHAAQTDVLQAIQHLYPASEVQMMVLNRSYRSTEQIVAFTSCLLLDSEHIIPFQRTGKVPSLASVGSREALHEHLRRKITTLRAEGVQHIAIITKSAEESERAFDQLQTLHDLRLIKSSTMEWERGVVVIPAYLAKGIEFDVAIVYDASEEVYGAEEQRKLFYTVCTRAMHELYIYSIGKPTSFVDPAIRQGLLTMTTE